MKRLINDFVKEKLPSPPLTPNTVAANAKKYRDDKKELKKQKKNNDLEQKPMVTPILKPTLMDEVYKDSQMRIKLYGEMMEEYFPKNRQGNFDYEGFNRDVQRNNLHNMITWYRLFRGYNSYYVNIEELKDFDPTIDYWNHPLSKENHDHHYKYFVPHEAITFRQNYANNNPF